ncbi:MAG: hypothetical protein KGM24_01090 [Elusimicrobia bacterium]|nr:hypothetical protein [Elusimicrobiota bacterium]
MLAASPLSALAAPADPDAFGSALVRLRRTQAELSRCVEAKKAILSEPQAAGRGNAEGASCSPKISVDMVMVDPLLRGEVSADLIARQVCRAVAARSPNPCIPLADIPGKPESGERMCRRLYRMILFSKDLMAGSRGVGASCAAWCRLAPTLPPPDLIGEVCGLIVQKDYVRTCSVIAQWKHAPRGYATKECAWEMRSVLGLGTEQSCRDSYRPGTDVCWATALYRRALQSHDADACGDNPLCRVMSGAGPAACAPLDAAIETRACEAFSQLGPGSNAAQAPAVGAEREIGRLDQDCLAVRNKAAREIEDARRALESRRRGSAPDAARRQRALAGLEAAQKRLETAYDGAASTSHSP